MVLAHHRCLKRVALGLAALLVSIACGCDYVPERPPLGQSDEAPQPADEPAAIATAAGSRDADEASDGRAHPAQYEPPGESVDRARETWDAYRLGDSAVGFRHTVIAPAGLGEGDYLRYAVEEQLTIRRGDDSLTQRFEQTSIETSGGQLVRFSARMEMGPSVTETEGEVQFDSILITTRRNGEQAQRTVPWRPEYRGLFAVEQSLRNKPMQPGETRQMRMLLPVQYTLGEVQLRAIGYARVPLQDGSTPRLLEIESTVRSGEMPLMRSTLWTDEQGDTLKAYLPALDLTTERTTREVATRTAGAPVDLLAATRIGLNGAIDPASAGTTYRVTHASEDPAALIASSGRQRVRSIGPRVAEVQVAPADAPEAPPEEADRAAGPLIESRDTAVQQIAREIQHDPAQPWETAVRLRDFVHRYVQSKDFSRGFATAAEVARDATGDCTEHSVLLAALCRAKGIPAKVAAGLVYLPGPDGPHMAYHMWTLAWDGNRWRPLDAMFGQREIGADRIELVVSNLSDGNEYACLAPVIQVIGQLEVEVVRSE